jgi:hypothetical protein
MVRPKYLRTYIFGLTIHFSMSQHKDRIVPAVKKLPLEVRLELKNQRIQEKWFKASQTLAETYHICYLEGHEPQLCVKRNVPPFDENDGGEWSPPK